MKKNITPYLSTCLLALMQVTCCANDTHLDWLKDLYQYEAWAGATQTNYLRLVQDWTPDITAYGATNHIAQLVGEKHEGFSESYLSFHSTNLTGKVTLRIIETPSALDAQEAMMNFFSNCAAIQPFPSGSTIGVNLGDHCYKGYPANSTNSLMFVRNNVFVNLSVDDSRMSILGIAEKIDRQLLSASLVL